MDWNWYRGIRYAHFVFDIECPKRFSVNSLNRSGWLKITFISILKIFLIFNDFFKVTGNIKTTASIKILNFLLYMIHEGTLKILFKFVNRFCNNKYTKNHSFTFLSLMKWFLNISGRNPETVSGLRKRCLSLLVHLSVLLYLRKFWLTGYVKNGISYRLQIRQSDQQLDKLNTWNCWCRFVSEFVSSSVYQYICSKQFRVNTISSQRYNLEACILYEGIFRLEWIHETIRLESLVHWSVRPSKNKFWLSSSEQWSLETQSFCISVLFDNNDVSKMIWSQYLKFGK